MACAASIRLLDSPEFRPRSTRCLPQSCRKRCAPSRGKSLLRAAKMQKSDAYTARLNPMPSVLLSQDHLRGGRESLPKVVLQLMRGYHSALSRARLPVPSSLCKRRSLQDAKRIGTQPSDKGSHTRARRAHNKLVPPALPALASALDTTPPA